MRQFGEKWTERARSEWICRDTLGNEHSGIPRLLLAGSFLPAAFSLHTAICNIATARWEICPEGFQEFSGELGKNRSFSACFPQGTAFPFIPVATGTGTFQKIEDATENC
jgi:hypothetical protein